MTLKSDLAKYAEKQCATYGAGGRCKLDQPCVFFDETTDGIKRCNYAENCVLPGNDKLHERYKSAVFGGGTADMPLCARCGETFERKSNAQRYCNACGEQAKKERRRRQNRENYERRKEQG